MDAASWQWSATPIDPSTRTVAPAASAASTILTSSASRTARSTTAGAGSGEGLTAAIVAERIGRCFDVARGGLLRRTVAPVSNDQARAVVVGGGITGCSVAYHLAAAGWTDVLLVEKHQLTAGSTCQAAGLVTAFNPSSTMMSFRRYSISLYERLGVFERVGSLRLASSDGPAPRAPADGEPRPRDRP